LAEEHLYTEIVCLFSSCKIFYNLCLVLRFIDQSQTTSRLGLS